MTSKTHPAPSSSDSAAVIVFSCVVLAIGFVLGLGLAHDRIERLNRHIEILASDVEDLSDLVPDSEIARRACGDVDRALAEVPVKED